MSNLANDFGSRPACKRRRSLTGLSLALAVAANASPALAFDRRLAHDVTAALGLSHFDGPELVLLAIFLLIASALLALVMQRVLEERTFGVLVNTVVAFAGALGGLHAYARYALWHNGMAFGFAAIACFAGAVLSVVLLSAARIWVLDEAETALAGGGGPGVKRPVHGGPPSERVRSVVARRPR